jgi:hypothetical protein
LYPDDYHSEIAEMQQAHVSDIVSRYTKAATPLLRMSQSCKKASVVLSDCVGRRGRNAPAVVASLHLWFTAISYLKPNALQRVAQSVLKQLA